MHASLTFLKSLPVRIQSTEGVAVAMLLIGCLGYGCAKMASASRRPKRVSTEVDTEALVSGTTASKASEIMHLWIARVHPCDHGVIVAWHASPFSRASF